MPRLSGTASPDPLFAIGWDWDPRWCKDAEELQKPCKKNHVNRGVTTDAKLICLTCHPNGARR